MKAYTDIEQSKKLVEILPLDSADGYWFKGFPPQPYMVYTKGTPNPGEHIPCWSVVALLNFIKDTCSYFELVYLSSTIDGRANRLENVYRLSTVTHDVYENELIDACYEMIIKLHEQKLL